MRLKKVSILSAGEVCGVASALLGVILGVLNLISTIGISMIPVVMGISSEFSNIFGTSVLGAGMFGMVGAIILIPVFVIAGGILGFIKGVILSVIFNIGLRIVGGLELNMEAKDGG